MKKNKRLLCAAVAVAFTLGLGCGAFSGCVSTNNEEDVKQIIATVDMSADSNFVKEFGEDYASAIVKEEINKRDLLLTYINVGSNYSGSSTGDTFKSLAESLVQNSVITQYSTVALLKNKIDAGAKYTADGSERTYSLEEFKNIDKDGELSAVQKEIKKYEYILGGTSSEPVKKANYNLNKLLNNTLDSYEKNYLKEEEKSATGEDSRSTPAGVDTEKEDYIPQSYGVYTGYKGHYIEDAGTEYEKLDGTSRLTRRKAYASLISFLKSNYLISAEDSDLTDVFKLSYVNQTYVNYLKSQLISEYGKMVEAELESIIDSTDENGVYTYIKAQYDGVDGELTKQSNAYSKASSFESAMNSISDTSFILYSPDTSKDTKQLPDGNGGYTYGTYGYVYNILLPFSASQQIPLKDLQGRRDSGNMTKEEYLYNRNQIMKEITTTDQRAAWFNGVQDYSFNATESTLTEWYKKDAGKNYLFFENNLKDSDKYNKLEKYAGLYPYNGTVKKNVKGYSLVPEKLDVDGMLNEFEAYVNYVINFGSGASTDYVSWNYGDELGNTTFTKDDYYNRTSYYKADTNKKEIDYSYLVYATGKVDLSDTSADMFVKSTNRYKAMSAVNELQYAYTTDTGVLSQYIGYTVSAYTTNYIKEFEYAAQQAVRMGAGAFKVCAGDYGWHLIYVTETYSFKTDGSGNYDGSVYTLNWTKDRIDTEDDTFEKRFYEWIKDSDLTNAASKKQSDILFRYNTQSAVTMFTDAYKDLTELS